MPVTQNQVYKYVHVYMFNLLDVHSDKKPSDAALNGILRILPNWTNNWIVDLGAPINAFQPNSSGGLLALQYCMERWKIGRALSLHLVIPIGYCEKGKRTESGSEDTEESSILYSQPAHILCMCTHTKCDGRYRHVYVYLHYTCEVLYTCTFVCTLVSQTLC